MEPASILSAAAAISAITGKAWELGSFLREICQGAKTVDSRVRLLESAVNELAKACEQVQGQFESMASGLSSKTPELVWDIQGSLTAFVESQVKDCRTTLKELRKLVVELRPGSFSFFSRGSRHVKLQDRGQQINDFRVRIKTHTDALQMSLQIVIIKIALATPDFLLRPLVAALEDLRVRLSRIENNTKPFARRLGGGEAHGSQFLEHAQEVFRRGTTLYETSMAGSVADLEPATGSERAARIKEWANKVDALRGDHTDTRSVNRPSTMSADDLPEKEPCADVAEKPSDTSPVSVSVDLCPVDQLASSPETYSVVKAKATQGIPVAYDGERLSTTEQPTGVASIKEHLGVLNYADSTDADGTRLSEASHSLHSSSRSSSISHESATTTPHLAEKIDKGKAPGLDTALPAGLSPKDVNKANRISFQQSLSNSSPMGPASRTYLVNLQKIEINGELEASICTGNSIEPASLSRLVPSQVASTVLMPATPKFQRRKNDLALLLAVIFRDIYLIKPLIKRGYSPHADLVYSQDRNQSTPMEFAIATRCEPVIRELLDNVPVLPCAHGQVLLGVLLNHGNLRISPPSGIESIKRVIDLLMPARSLAYAACDCGPFENPAGRIPPCHQCVWQLINDSCNMPSHMHDYRLPLVTHLLQYTKFPGGMPLYRVLDARLTKAVILGFPTVVKFLITETTEDSLLRTWLKKNYFMRLLELAILRAINLPKISLDTVRVLLEMEADLQAKDPSGQPAIRLRERAINPALKSKRADLVALVETYNERT